jgi:L-fuconolactonase
MKIDAHQHFWQYNPDEYSWIDESMNKLKRDFLPSDLNTELEGMQFQGTIAVQARQSMDETRWLLSLGEQYDFIKGVVGWVDLCSQEGDIQLQELKSFSKLVGIRHVIHDEPDIDFMLRDDFKRGIEELAKHNLVYDLLIFPEHLSRANKLVNAFPEQVFVLDHIAKPQIKEQLYEPWKTDIAELAGHPNVYCKLSGMVTEADWENWKKEDFTPYLDHVISCFGVQRLMIGSDWPVCTVAGSYRKTLQLVIDYLGQYPPVVQENILGGTCSKVYLERKS